MNVYKYNFNYDVPIHVLSYYICGQMDTNFGVSK